MNRLEQGFEQGRAEGRAEGRDAGKVELILNMLREKMPLEMIAKVSDLSPDKVRELGKMHSLLNMSSDLFLRDERYIKAYNPYA